MNNGISELAFIGKEVEINAKEIVIEDYVYISGKTIINAEKLHIGKYTRIRGAQIIAKTVKFGQGCKIDEIIAGGGGARSNSSYLICGDYVQLNTENRLNTDVGILCDDYSAIAPRCEILTHGFWQPALDGYTVSRNPVHLKRNSWVTTRCVVLAGITIGENSVVLAGSVVTKDVDDNVLTGGVPAKPIRTNYPLKLSEEDQKALIQSHIIKLKERLFLNLYCEHCIKSRIRFVFDSNISKDQIISFTSKHGGITFDFHNRIITGHGDDKSEQIRNYFRRNAIFFDLVFYYHDDPFISKYWCHIKGDW